MRALVPARARFAGLVAIAIGSVLFLGGVSAAWANPRPNYMTGNQRVAPPPGYVEFCRRRAEECPRPSGEPASMSSSRGAAHLSDAQRQQLEDVNRRVNREIRQVNFRPDHDAETYWDLPVDSGNCHDLALEKRHRLRALGWDARRLRIATAVLPSGEGHAVLTIDTDEGTLVLDNLTQAIRVWKETPYIWVSRENPGQQAWNLVVN